MYFLYMYVYIYIYIYICLNAYFLFGETVVRSAQSTLASGPDRNHKRTVPFIPMPMPMPMPVCRTNLYNKIVQLEVCRTCSGSGMGINGTAQ